MVSILKIKILQKCNVSATAEMNCNKISLCDIYGPSKPYSPLKFGNLKTQYGDWLPVKQALKVI